MSSKVFRPVLCPHYKYIYIWYFFKLADNEVQRIISGIGFALDNRDANLCE